MEQKHLSNISESPKSDCIALSIFRTLEKNYIEYVYIGHFTSGITDSILSLAELNLQLKNESIKIRKRVYFILVEGLQNITRHQEFSPIHADKSGGLIIQYKDNRFIITTINHIHTSEKEKLKGHIDEINQLKGSELKRYYRQILRQQKISRKGGAGLGLIEIARKSNSKLLYDFEDIGNGYSIFFLQTHISPQNESVVNQDSYENLAMIKEAYHKLVDCSIHFSIAGIFVQDKIVYMLSLLEKRLLATVSNKNKIFNIIVELLQNLVNHADDYEINNKIGHYGIFYVAESQDYIIITTGNYVKNKKINFIQKNLDFLNSLTIRELTEKHRNILKIFKDNKTVKTGLGLINLRMKTKERISYSFIKVDDNYSFLSIEVRMKKDRKKIFNLTIKPTRNTPEIILSNTDAKYFFTGNCMPKDPKAFFMPVYSWFMKYIKNPHNITPLIFDFKLIDKSVLEALVKLFSILDELNSRSIVTIRWNYDEEGDEVYKMGEYLHKLYPDIEFKFIRRN